MTRNIGFSFLVLMLLPLAGFAQQDRIPGRIDRGRMVLLKGNVHRNVQSRFDEGAVDPAVNISLVTLMLKPSANQQAALDQFLAEQQNPASPNYHRWLTPEEYADRFGVSTSDMAKIGSWLQSEGLAVDDSSRGRNWIVLHGTVAQIQNAFATEIHHYRVNGELHFANAMEPSVPAAIEPLVTGILGLNDFKMKPRAKVIKQSGQAAVAPDFTAGTQHYMAPDDFATIYDVKALYNAGIDGTGQKIVVAGQTDIALSDIQKFQTDFNLPSKNPQLVLVPGSTDPGTTDDLGEADLDVEWSSAVARNASIVYVYSQDAINSAIYAISQNLAPVVTLSYGGCEADQFSGAGSLLRTIAQQASAQGITWLASSGDSGAAACDHAFSSSSAAAIHAIGVNFPASIPEITAVGGTQFTEGNGSYWNTTNSTNGGSAISYIPEASWNESSSSNGLAATGGGLSIFFSKPSWQTGPGVPSANARSVPDVALTAADHDGYTGESGGGGVVFSGTSAATPSLAGIIALLNQYQSSHGGSASQGNINPTLYHLAQTVTGVFHDVTTGNNIVPCTSAATGCSSGSYGYSAGVGYDLVTGLGSVDANVLVTQWSKGTVTVQPQAPFHLQPFGGDLQAAAAGSALPQPIVVSAQDVNGLPISGVTVTFSVVLGGGSVSPAIAVTNTSGLAQTQMTLGPAAGTQIVLASANQFASTGVVEIAGANNSGFGLAYARSGDNQTASINTALPTAITLTVVDPSTKLLPGVPVSWIVTAGGGSVTPTAAVTDSNGKISATWTLGPTVGTQTIQAIPFYYNGASIYGFHGTTFTATAQPGSTNNPTPALTSISPTSAAAGAASFTLTATGTNFVNGSVVQWNGASRTTAFVSGTQLSASITAADIAAAGTAQVTVFTPTPGGGVSGSVGFTITGSSSGAPNVPSNGIVNGAGFNSSVAGLSPGAIVSIFGTALSNAPSTGVQPGLVPGTSTLFTTSSGTTVTFDGIAAPLFFVSPTQLNVQVPFEVAGKSSSQVIVSRNGSNSVPVTVSVRPATPGLFTADSSGTGPAALLNADNSSNAANNPAAAGSVIQIFATGLGAVSPVGITGVLAPSSTPLALSVSNPNVTVGGLPAVVQFSGLAPGFVGLWQVNVVVPTGGPTGAVPLVVTSGGQNANPVTVFVK